MSYLLLNVDAPPSTNPEGAALKEAFGGLVEIVGGTPHLYRRKGLMGRMPSEPEMEEGTWNFAVLGRREGVPLELLIKALEICKGKVRRIRYFEGATHCYLLQIEANTLKHSKELITILSGFEIEPTGTLLAVAPLTQQHTNKKPNTWADQESEMSFSHPVDAPPTPLAHDKPASNTAITPPLKVVDYTELPLCASCFERLDASISGVKHMLCTHTKECKCHFSSSCRVCRSWRACAQHREGSPQGLDGVVTQLFNASFTSSSSSSSCSSPLAPLSVASPRASPELSTCEVCHTKDSLWACLICGFIGCGRYTEQHTLRHCFDTGHTLVMELTSQKIWDYDGDLFIHRLLIHQSNKDVLPDQWDCDKKESVTGKSIVDAKVETKHELICLEFSHLLAHQMESARRYNEQVLLREKEYSERVMQEGEHEVKLLEKKLEVEAGVTQLLVDAKEEVERELKQVQTEYIAMEEELKKIAIEKEEALREQECVKKEIEKAMRSSFEEVKSIDGDIEALRDQIRDLEAAVEMRRKCKGIDTSNSITFIGTSASTKARKGRRR